MLLALFSTRILLFPESVSVRSSAVEKAAVAPPGRAHSAPVAGYFKKVCATAEEAIEAANIAMEDFMVMSGIVN